MKLSFGQLALFGLSFGLPAGAPAALNPALLDAKANWVFYADLQAMRSSATGKYLIENRGAPWLPPMGPLPDLKFNQAITAVDEITIYGIHPPVADVSPDGVLILQGHSGMGKIIREVFLKSGAGREESALADYPFPAYRLDGKSPAPDRAGQAVIAFPTDTLVLLGRSKEQLLQAYAVITKTADPLANAPSSALGQLVQDAGDAYVFGASTVLLAKGPNEGGPQARMLRLASSASVAFGEKDGRTIARSRLVANDEATALKLFKIAQGLTAMLSLAETNDSDIAAFLEAVTVEKTDRTVTLELAYPSERILKMLQAYGPKRSPGRHGEARGSAAPDDKPAQKPPAPKP